MLIRIKESVLFSNELFRIFTEINQQMLNHIQVNIHNIAEQLLVQEMFCQENICMYLVMIDQRYLSEKKKILSTDSHSVTEDDVLSK
jgi:hypothetical protein